MRIRIIGGSLGGLFAAALLHRDGHDVRVYDRSVLGLGGRGAGLVAQREVFAILRAIGCEHVARIGVVAQERVTLARAGGFASRHASPQTQLSWDSLYDSFRQQIPADRYVLDAPVQSVRQDDEQAYLMFADGREESADLIIGADGVGSIVRSAVLGAPSPSAYAGYVAWRGLYSERAMPADAAAQLFGRFAYFVMPQSHALGYLVAGPHGDTAPGTRRYNWVWYRPARGAAGRAAALTDAHGQVHEFSLAPGMVADAVRTQLIADAGDLLPPAFAAAVATEPRPFVQAIFDFEARHMAHGRLALLGDAAFVVRPHTAMGVSKAAGDALALRQQLAAMPVIPALQAYSSERVVVGRAIAAHGRALGASLE